MPLYYWMKAGSSEGTLANSATSQILEQDRRSWFLVYNIHTNTVRDLYFLTHFLRTLWLERVAMTAIQSTAFTIYQILGLISLILFHQIPLPGLRIPIFFSSLTWNLTLRWIASWFLQKCKKILNKIHYVCSQPQKKEEKFTNSDAYGHSNTKLLQKLRLYSNKRIFRYIYYVSSIQQCVVRKNSS